VNLIIRFCVLACQLTHTVIGPALMHGETVDHVFATWKSLEDSYIEHWWVESVQCTQDQVAQGNPSSAGVGGFTDNLKAELLAILQA